MDTSEIHYLTYDPDEIYKDLQETWIESGGDVLYPGDEKEMGVRAMVAVLVQAFAGIDNGLRMATLRYAIGKYLDLYGEKDYATAWKHRGRRLPLKSNCGQPGGAERLLPERF